MKKRMALLMAAVVLAFTLTGCHEADKVNHNMNVAADNFSCERRITVYNARTDKIILYAEGYGNVIEHKKPITFYFEMEGKKDG